MHRRNTAMPAATLPPETRLLKVSAVAKQLSMGTTSVYKLMDSGQLPYVKIGKTRRVPLSAVERLVRENTVGAA